MFRFLRRGPSSESSRSILQALAQQQPSGVDGLRVLTQSGNYAGRTVRYFRAFDTDAAAQRAIAIRTFNDLDAHPELVVASGHVESNGTVALTRRDPSIRPASAARAQADRAEHGDDAHVVFPGTAT